MPPKSLHRPKLINLCHNKKKRFQPVALRLPRVKFKPVRCPYLDKHILSNNIIRTVLKLKTLILSRPQRSVPLNFLEKYRNYLCFTERISVYQKVSTYPTIFEFFRMGKLGLVVRLTKEAEALADEELKFKSSIEDILATRVQKFLMLAVSRRILLSKISYIHDDLGLLPNFRHRFCNDHPDKFKIVDTRHGPALELVTWDPSLAKVLPRKDHNLIVDRPLKFKTLRLRKGLVIPKCHYDFLLEFQELPEMCPYMSRPLYNARASVMFEKRACAAVREVLALMIAKWTMIDHLMLFRNDFGLLTAVRGMLIRHPDLFHVSQRAHRDSVMLVEGFDYNGKLIEMDKSMVFRRRFVEMVLEGKRMLVNDKRASVGQTYVGGGKTFHGESEYIDGFEDLFAVEDVNPVNDYSDAENILRGWESWFVNPSSISSADDGA